MLRRVAALVTASLLACAGEATRPPEVAPPPASPPPEAPAAAPIAPVPADISPPALEHLGVAVGGHRIQVHVKRPPAPWGAIVLVHGRTWSALPDFDLQVPGARVSLMDNLAAEGLAVYAVDLRGYGATARDPSGYTDSFQAADDLAAVVGLAGENLANKPAVLGWSLGARIAALAAQRHRDAIGPLILYGSPCPPQTPARPSAAPPRPPKPPAQAANTEAAARSDFITPEALEPGVADAFVAAALAADPIKADWRDVDAWIDFSALRNPVLAIHGDRDPVVDQSCLNERLAQLPGGAQLEVLPGYDHAAHLERAAPRFAAAVVGFVRKHGVPRG
ncbi:alpha/beta hydrolase [Nannocystis punicea]|uniref:Alpha/beta fold hydrolase n=1 Tax=Nannocystis punicea TaxID=2995304 RepID=A0ABY7HC73_9BACT|nr:alpha/beta fold hydrolase [Nannocystis poenicansa]WAS96695.1 alpha/beta fold hydrolase [Nannocystis poenicansa]